MPQILVIVIAVWFGLFCLIAPFVIALVRTAARADEREEIMQREEALRREVALNRLEGVRSPTGRRFFARPEARQALDELLR